MDLSRLQRRLQYEFDNIELLKLALTHKSKGKRNYERLEFLGDSILGFVVAESLYHTFPGLNEGSLSRMRARLVCKETLAEQARLLELGSYLSLGEGELKSGGFNRDSILSDCLESIIAAIYLDSSIVTTKKFIRQIFNPFITNLSAETNFKDAKSQLQEYMQKQAMSLPQYDIVDASGEQHKQVFTVKCYCHELDIGFEAKATSRRIAEQKAAALVLESLLKK